MGALQDLAESIRTQRQSCAQAVERVLSRIEAVDRQVHAFLQIQDEAARARAREIDDRLARGDAVGLLAGVPIAVKDNICTANGKTTCGSKMLASFESRYNAHVVDRLESAGVVIVGKTNLDEFAMGSSTENSAFGPTRNPWDAGKVAGGSSGGSAAAVAANMVPAALGSDTGGSIRQPASFCGVTGFKPTYGLASRYGLVAFGSSLDQIGPIAQDAVDVALLLQAIVGHDPRDATSLDRPVPDYIAALQRPVDKLRIGISEEAFGDGLDAQVEQAVRGAIDELQRLGAEFVPVQLPHIDHATACYYIIATAEASSNLARFDGVHYGFRAEGSASMKALYTQSRGQGLGDEVQRRIMLGTYVLSSGYYDAFYDKALRVRTLITRDFDAAFDRVDLIASPACPTTAFPIGEKTDDPLAMYLSDIYTIGPNLAGLPAISLPCGFDDAGLPIGLQLVGPPLGDATILAAAHAYQLQTNFHQQNPPCLNSMDPPS
ncbi:MAG: Asp-tRNA(Asn)/Glu-tRNA(Gln) amidotransferase subunit GatA [Phycisphaerae bacterium]